MSFDNSLEAALLNAHEANDVEGLVRLYRQAGEQALAANDEDAGCFYLTHAYIFGLECGAKEVWEIHQVLVSFGREK